MIILNQLLINVDSVVGFDCMILFVVEVFEYCVCDVESVVGVGDEVVVVKVYVVV